MLINAAQTREYLRKFDFTSLFIEVLGWDNYKSNLVVSAGGHDYTLTGIAHKRGVGAFVCSPQPDGHVPDRITRRKIERELARVIHEHLIIYPDGKQTMQVWQTVTHKAGRPIASPEHTYYAGQPGDSLISKLQDIAISLDEEESIGVFDVVTRVSAAFNAEKVTKKFYERFQKEHDAFLTFITGIPDEGLQRWYASVMLNRLMFIYFIQEKGFLDGKPDYLKRKLAQSKAEGQDRYYSVFLRTLFFDGFATRQGDRTADAKRLLGDIPYLNGGIFAPHQIEQLHCKQIQIPDAAFDRLFSFFEAYNWHLDERPLRNDNEINPDVLGYIFEKYINQKQMGAYYTKEDITEYISKNTIVPFLFDATRKEVAIAFRPDGPVWRLLQEDPDRYIYPAVRKGAELPLPPEIQAGVKDVSQRGGWNRPAPEEYALPTEIWREVVARRTRYAEVREKLESGGVTDINDLITLNLDIRQFAQDAIENAEGPELVLAFYRSIERITVLDPTCGSGAFLFAALNILEPLYEACLDKMQGFIDELAASDGKHSPLKYSNFRDILAEAGRRTNRRYFIYKSIILNNLYGVDIMEEAVEICKLRLFLKLVAQVDRDPGKENGGIEPLPDIDFNILAGNTLVGFATEGEVMQAVTSKGVKGGGTQFKMEFDDTRERFEEKLRKADFAARNFRLQQTQLGGEITADDKTELRGILDELADELDRYLATEYGVDTNNPPAFKRWRDSHEPFHWFVEFYGIMKRGGFDVIIGNPPYVEYYPAKFGYEIKGLETLVCANLYTLVIERCHKLLDQYGVHGMILPIAAFSTKNMAPFIHAFERWFTRTWLSFFHFRPSMLFSGGKVASIPTCVYIARKVGAGRYSTPVIKWATETRETLFATLAYAEIKTPGDPLNHHYYPKFGDPLENSIMGKILAQDVITRYLGPNVGPNSMYYRSAGGLYWKIFINYPWPYETTSNKQCRFQLGVSRDVLVPLLNSSTFWWYYTTTFDTFNLKDYMLFGFRFTYPSDHRILTDLEGLCAQLMANYQTNAKHLMRGKTGSYTVYAKKSKPIIDEIDRVLAQHYGFTDEELDFIINYDIKYRMGRDAEEEGEDDEPVGEKAAGSKQQAVARPVAAPIVPAEAQAEKVAQAARVAQAVPAPQPPTFATLTPERPSQGSFEPRPRQVGLGEPAGQPSTLRVGDRVRHHVFGEGQVLVVEPQGDDRVVTVQFAGVGKKRLSSKAARLERV